VVQTAIRVALASAALVALVACDEKTQAPARPPVSVTVMTLNAEDTPVDFEFVAQTQSSREVEIRARVEGFLERRLYREGEIVRAGQTLFQMDRRPFEAALQSAKGQLAQQEARRDIARANLARVRPLAEENALSKKDLDDAIGNDKAAEAAVLAAQGQVETARLNLSYTTISSPLTGVSSYARKQEGSYIGPGEASLLTYVSQLDPIWVNFSVSENELLKLRDDVARQRLKAPPGDDFEVEVILADGSVVPRRGRMTFSENSFSKETGTFLVRAVFANPRGQLRPGQFVRARIKGAVRPNAIVVPQRAVLQGPKSHYVWVVTKEGKAEQRAVQASEWHGDRWFIDQGLRAGERIVVDGAIRVAAGAPLKIAEAAPPPPAAGGRMATTSAPAVETLELKAAPAIRER
jgi:membrane fusion protein (multidrug efflux system)